MNQQIKEIASFTILTLVISVGVNAYINQKNLASSAETGTSLTEEEQISILQSLRESSTVEPITHAQQLEVLQKMKEGSEEKRPLTSEEQLQILQSLKN